MHNIHRIKLAFGEDEGGETPRSRTAPITHAAPRAQETSPMRPKSANAGPSTTPGPSPNAAKDGPRPMPSVFDTRYGPTPKPAPKLAGAKSSTIPPNPSKAGPGEGEILVAVMGVTGSGKSHFCRAATRDDSIGVGHGLGSCTQKPTMHQLSLPTGGGEARVTLIDTPGFNDSMRNDAEILTEITLELHKTYKQNRKLSGIIYFHRISDPRMERSGVKQLHIFRELCGDDNGTLKNVILATNRWDRLESEEVGIKRQSELESNPRYWKPLCMRGSQVMRFEGTTESALELIRLVMRNTPLPLKIQKEMADESKPLAETGAGRFVEVEIDKLCLELSKDLSVIRSEMEFALQKKDEDMQALLGGESVRLKKEIEELRKQQEMMKANAEKMLTTWCEERKSWTVERERMEDEMAQLKVGIKDAGAQSEETAFKTMENKQLAPGLRDLPLPPPEANSGGSYGPQDIRPVGTRDLQAAISAFNRGKTAANGGPSLNLVDPPPSAVDIPPLLKVAYAALDTILNLPSLETYLSEARRSLETITSNRLVVYHSERDARLQSAQADVAALLQTGRFTSIEQIPGEFGQEARRKMEVDKEIYLMWDQEYFGVAYKQIKGQLELLGGKWYEEVKAWLFDASTAAAARSRASGNTSEPGATGSGGTALEYHLLLEVIDLLNTQYITVEEREHVLQSLVSERNAYYEQLSVKPLATIGEYARYLDVQKRYRIDEQERLMRGKLERAQRAKEHAKAVEKVVSDLVGGLRSRFEEVADAIYYAIRHQFPPALRKLFRRFFVSNPSVGAIHSPASRYTRSESPPPVSSDFTIPMEVLQVAADSIQTLGEIVGLIKIAMGLQNAPQIYVCEATTALAVAQDQMRPLSGFEPSAAAAEFSKALADRVPAALDRVREQQVRVGEKAMGDLMEAHQKLQRFLATVQAEGGRPSPAGAGVQTPLPQQHWPPEPEEQQQQQQQFADQLAYRGNAAGAPILVSMIGSSRLRPRTNSLLNLLSDYPLTEYFPARQCGTTLLEIDGNRNNVYHGQTGYH